MSGDSDYLQDPFPKGSKISQITIPTLELTDYFHKILVTCLTQSNVVEQIKNLHFTYYSDRIQIETDLCRTHIIDSLKLKDFRENMFIKIYIHNTQCILKFWCSIFININ